MFDEFLILRYRERYNLTMNDPKLLSLSQLDILFDEKLLAYYKEHKHEKRDDMANDFSQEEMESFWDDDSIYKEE